MDNLFHIMKKILSLTIAIMALTACCKTNPFLQEWDTPYGIPPFEKIKVAHYLPAVNAGIEQQNAEIQAIIDNPEAPTFENTIAAYDLSGALLAKVTGVLFNLSESDSNPALDKALEEIDPLITAHRDNIFMNPALFARVKAVYEGDRSGLTREEQMVLKGMYERFVRNGIDLPAEDQEKLRAINTSLSSLMRKFGGDLLAENNAFKEECGIPVSSYSQTMTSSADRAYREKLFRAYSTRGAHGNSSDTRETLLQILKLRAQKATLLGYPDYASYQLDNKMAHDPQTVDAFLQEIMDASMRRAKEEVVDMQAEMDKDIAAGLLPEGSTIEPWDWFYYAERVRKEKYDLDEEQIRQYFKLENVRDGAFYAAHKVYGINITPEENLPIYHPEVRTFKVTDADGSLLSLFMTDYLPRSSKRGGAWMDGFRDQYIDAQGNDVRPIVVNVCNFTPPQDGKPSLITVDEVETLFHEFGHALHGMLSKCRYRSVSGTAVTRDFVETFSQFNENWAYVPEIMSQYARHYETGETIPDSLVTRILQSRKFNQGFLTGELCAASILDLKWHCLSEAELENIDIDAFEAKVCREMGLIDEIIPRYRTSYFNHIFASDGYSTGYYSYLWSLVLAVDAFDLFEQNGVFDQATARSFRETFLEKGGSEEPMTLYRSFRGADPDPKALIRSKGL